MYTKITSQELDFFELTSLSVKVFINRLIEIFIVVFLIITPVRIADLLISNYICKPDQHPFISMLITIIEYFIILIPTMMLILVADSEINNLKVKLGHIFKKTIFLWKGAIITNILEGFITFALLLLLIIPGIVWSVYYIFSSQAVTLHNLTGKEALNYSKFLVRGRWWKVFLITLAYGVIYFIIFWILKIPKNAAGNMIDLKLVLIPVRELANAFLIVASSLLYINLYSMVEKGDREEKPAMLDYLLTKTGGEIDDCEVDFDYGQENDELACPECGCKLQDIDIFCPECGKEIIKEE